MKRIFSFFFVLCVFSAASLCEAKRLPESWETLVIKGNQYEERVRLDDAIEYYLQAIEILEKQNIDDIRAAVVYKDIAAAYAGDLKPHMAKIYENKSAEIYKREIEEGKLGAEYTQTDNLDPLFITLRPACPLCHLIKGVVPLRFGADTGYSGTQPAESSAKFTHKPAGEEISDERWYCKSCKQMF